MTGIVIIGAGHAGVQLSASLREEGFSGRIVLLSAERDSPYQRPPLSKAFLKGETAASGLPLRGPTFFTQNDIDLKLGVTAHQVNRGQKRVVLSQGSTISYDHLVLATGTRTRSLPIPGIDLPFVYRLSTLQEAQAVKTALEASHHVVIIGAGFIGLEIAATACALQRHVTVVEKADRPLSRAVSPATSAFLTQAHRDFGAQFLFACGVAAIHDNTVVLSDARHLPADLVILGTGVVAEDRLAQEAGLACADGVLVDEDLVTQDPAISAIGDCARFPYNTSHIRLECVQNANDQAKHVARRLTGHTTPYHAVPWFWSDQGDLKLQIAGLSTGVDLWEIRETFEARQQTVLGFAENKLKVVETLNRSGDHMAARRLLATGTALSYEKAAAVDFDLRKCLLQQLPG